MSVRVEQMTAADWPAVAAIYREGIATGHATFTGEPPESFAEFCDGKIASCALVAREEPNNRIVGWAALAKISRRCVYEGVAEVSIYVASSARGRGVGNALLRGLIAKSEAEGVWTLQAGIFPENTASVVLHERNGFRVVGQLERMGKMTFGPLAGRWRDVLLLERRSTVAGV
jgi:L-amino acid N-acyltransferase YncA